MVFKRGVQELDIDVIDASKIVEDIYWELRYTQEARIKTQR